MPPPLDSRGGVLALECVGKGHSGLATSAIALEHVSNPCQMSSDRLLERKGKQGRAVAISFSLSHGELVASGIEIFDPQPQALEQPQSRSVQEPDDEGVLTAQVGEDGAHLFTCHHHGQTPRRSGSNGVAETLELTAENLSIEKEQGREGLVLGGRCHLAVDRQVREELDDFGRTQLVWVSNIVVVDVSPDPADVGLFGAIRIVTNSQRSTDAV